MTEPLAAGSPRRALPGIDWYVMLFPQQVSAAYTRLAESWRGVVGGGEVNPRPHVTVGYLVGEADTTTVVTALSELRLTAVTVEAAGAMSYTPVSHPLFGYAASLRVAKTAALTAVHEAIVAAVRPLGLSSMYRWHDADPHLQVLRRIEPPPQVFVPRLAQLEPRLSLEATRLVVSRPDGAGSFPVLLDRPLPGGDPDQREGSPPQHLDGAHPPAG